MISYHEKNTNNINNVAWSKISIVDDDQKTRVR